MDTILSLASSRTGIRHAAIVVAAAGLLLGATSVQSQSPVDKSGTQAVAARDVTTESTLQRDMQKGKRLADYKNSFEATPVEKVDLTPSLYRDSIILFDGENHTVVPLGAVLALPANYRNRILDKPKGVFLFWPAFMEKNKNWVGGWEVSMAMARGDAELAKGVMKQISQDSRVLVAVYKGGPITILEAVPDKATKTSGAKE